MTISLEIKVDERISNRNKTQPTMSVCKKWFYTALLFYKGDSNKSTKYISFPFLRIDA